MRMKTIDVCDPEARDGIDIRDRVGIGPDRFQMMRNGSYAGTIYEEQLLGARLHLPIPSEWSSLC
jgi:hypothetical protein